MTMYVVKVGTNVKTANPDSADSDRFAVPVGTAHIRAAADLAICGPVMPRFARIKKCLPTWDGLINDCWTGVGPAARHAHRRAAGLPSAWQPRPPVAQGLPSV